MKYLRIFKIKPEERIGALVTLVVMAAINGMVVYAYADKFMPISNDHWNLFIRNFAVSGFDPITYAVMTEWHASYNIYRHPLLAFFIYPFYWLNQGLMAITGVNCAQFICVGILLLCSVYSYVFAYRIFREIMRLRRFDATLLAALMFSFGYVMVSLSVPDHFGFSMAMLLCALYISGKCIDKGRTLNILQTVLLFIFTAGTSLNNGVKIFLDALFVNGRRFFRPTYLVLAVLLPAALMWGFARWEYKTFELPRAVERHEKGLRVAQIKRERHLKNFRDTTTIRDSAMQAKVFRELMRERARAKYRADHKRHDKKYGKPITEGEFMGWTDITTSRWDAFVENLFGEGLQLHQDQLLGDTLRNRDVIVRYRYWINYVAEGIIVALFLAGIWCGRRSRFLWMALAGMAFDMAIHMGLGFGINEVYIMSAHWMFVLPIAIGFLLTKRRPWLRVLLFCMTVYLLAWNLSLYTQYLIVL